MRIKIAHLKQNAEQRRRMRRMRLALKQIRYESIKRNMPGNIDHWRTMTTAKLRFATYWYQYKLRYERVTHLDWMIYCALAAL